jgi:hypothetical protein
MKTDDELQPLDEALEEAHHFLHACERDYHSPSAFRLNLNAFIQAARNVTFRLQSLKAGIPHSMIGIPLGRIIFGLIRSCSGSTMLVRKWSSERDLRR